MQGHRNSASTLPEHLTLDHGSTSDTGIDSQMPWNSMQTSAQNCLPDYRISSNETNIQYLHHVGHDGLNNEWSLGESSSGAVDSQDDHNGSKREHVWSIHPRAAFPLVEHQCEPSNILSLDNIDVKANSNQRANGSSLLPISGPDTLRQDLNLHSEFGDHENDTCQVAECPSTCISVGSSNAQILSTGSSSDSLGVPSRCGVDLTEENEDRPGYSLDGRRVSCKRKALEVNVGQSSGAGSTSCFQHAERSQRHTPAAQIVSSNICVSTQTENEQVINNGLEQTNPRLRLGVGGAVSASPFSLTARGTVESSRRNFRLRVNSSRQQDHTPGISFSTEADVVNADASSSRHASRLVLRDQSFDLNPAPSVENGSLHGQSALLHVPSVHHNPQSRWGGASSSRTSSSSASANSGEMDDTLFEESASRNIPRSVSDHPMFVPANEMGSSSQQPPSWSLADGSNSTAGNVVPTSRAGSTSGVNSSAPTWSHRSYPQYSRRMSEIVRRSLLSSASAESGGQTGNHGIRSSSSVNSQETGLSSGAGNHDHRISNLRSALMERHLDGAFGIPYSLRSLAAATSEGRSSMMSEQIRHVLDLMRRGEGLRFEDVMILDQSIFLGMADMHDRHRDMRLDVDNMSYEELLALEERIGNVCTGLNEESITSHLKQHKYMDGGANENDLETEPCSICREEYNDGEDLGTLECGHDFHRDCIKQWLMHKNLCPICKTTGLTT